MEDGGLQAIRRKPTDRHLDAAEPKVGDSEFSPQFRRTVGMHKTKWKSRAMSVNLTFTPSSRGSMTALTAYQPNQQLSQPPPTEARLYVVTRNPDKSREKKDEGHKLRNVSGVSHRYPWQSDRLKPGVYSTVGRCAIKMLSRNFAPWMSLAYDHDD